MKTLTVPAILAASLFASAAFADAAKPYVLNYAQFEATIEHVDLEKCGEVAATDDTFCRLVVTNDAFHVFEFSYDGDSPLVGIQSYSSDGIVNLLVSEPVGLKK